MKTSTHVERSGPMIGPGLDEGLISVGGHDYYHVPNVDQIPPFLMSIVSDGDRWMFISSSGALTAGRKDAEHALFPYETDDRLHQAGRRTGAVTSLRVEGVSQTWKPFHPETDTPTGRRLAKSVTSDAILFEEDHPVEPLTFGYQWASSDEYGFVRRAVLSNRGDHDISLSLVDGIVNVLPYGSNPGLELGMRNLTNAYKRSELISSRSSLAVYSMESRVSDRPEPSESLRANVVWSLCPEGFSVSLDRTAFDEFERGQPTTCGDVVTGRPGAYLIIGDVTLSAGSSMSWDLVCDVALDQVEVVAISDRLSTGVVTTASLDGALQRSRVNLSNLMGSADAVQCTGDRVASAYHASNVLNNVMRGGMPINGYDIDTDDFRVFVRQRNSEIFRQVTPFLSSLPRTISHSELLELIRLNGDTQFQRLGLEYLPFAFSRRHGDPSRPWNQFSIQVRDEDGRATCSYQGNWRDIFQNWEALCNSFPGYLTSVISVFLNASTVDGYNPYRISREGIDWEVPDANDPWANLGYWGDHQIAYLLALLESSERHQPGELSQLLDTALFSFADVPYRLADFDALLKNPKATISFDVEADNRSQQRVEELGGDGRLLWSNDTVHLVTLAEKLLIPALSKIANFVPGGGIWMNTQRPEWNDANNALVGNGLSVVTLFYLRRYFEHLRSLVPQNEELQLSAEVATWLQATTSALSDEIVTPDATDEEAHRFRLMSALGVAFSTYREQVVGRGFSGTTKISGAEIAQLCNLACVHLDATISRSRRSDGLFHSYNILHVDIGRQSASIQFLSEMLEGQVAALASGVLEPQDAISLVSTMFDSDLYRPDISNFILYPARQPKSFLSKNIISTARVAQNAFLVRCVETGDKTIVTRDIAGNYRFAANLASIADLDQALSSYSADAQVADLANTCRDQTLALFEHVYEHHSYTGRSSSMHAFEGIGSVYWHMVAKLLVALQKLMSEGSDDSTGRRHNEMLAELYWRVRTGMGPKKSAASWGAIPTDPYSHSPAHAGAQQPGMTGFAKEEVLARPFELGLSVEGGLIHLNTALLRRDEFISAPGAVEFRHLDGNLELVPLPPKSLLFSYCQVPVVVTLGDQPMTTVTFADGSVLSGEGSSLDTHTSGQIFARSGSVRRVEFTTVG